MEKTTNYKLFKPELGDRVSIGDINENMDILDEKLRDIETVKIDKSKILTTKEEIQAVTEPGFLADALVVAQLNSDLDTVLNLDDAAQFIVTSETGRDKTASIIAYRTSDLFTVTGNIITCLRTGQYVISFDSIYFSSHSGNILANLQLKTEGGLITLISASATSISDNLPGFINALAVRKLTAGEQYRITSYTSGNGTIGYNTNVSEAVSPNMLIFPLRLN